VVYSFPTGAAGGTMRPGPIQLHPKTYQRLVRLRREAERDGAYRVAEAAICIVERRWPQ
jgi:hypothetical protein